MGTNLRKSGIEVLGDIPWGSHFCQFYETKEDLMELLVPFFKAGLENNEYCMWVTADPMSTDDAFHALKEVVPQFQQFIEKKSIEILPYTSWFFKTGKFDGNQLINAWLQKLDEALAKGYDGIRINCNESWLDAIVWDNFMIYEQKLNNILRYRRIVAMCTYPLSSSAAGRILDVAHAHEALVAKRKGKWEILEQPEIKKLKSQLKIRSDELEQKVLERTEELSKVIVRLKQEISERKATEDKLITEKELSKTIRESFPGIFKIIDKNFHILAWNRVFEEFTGYTATEIPHLQTMNDLHDVSDRERAYDLHQQAFAKGTIKGDFKIRIKDGRIREVFIVGQRINYEGKTCLIICGIDITERKRAEEQIKRQVELSHEIIDAIPTMTWCILPDGSLEFVNQRWADYAGLSLDEGIKQPTGIVHPDDLPKMMRTWLPHRDAGKFHEAEMRLRRADGVYRWFLVRTAPFKDANGTIFKWYGVSIDIEESKRAEDALRLAYQRLSYHVENTPLAVIEWDKDWFITRWSGQAEKIFGWKASEVLGTNMYDPDFNIIYEEDIPQVNKIAHELIHGAVNRNLSVNRNYTKDGKMIYCEWYNSVLRDESGNVITILSLTHDVTERKLAEEKLSQSYEQIRALNEHLRNIREEERKYIIREIHDELGQYLTILKLDVAILNEKLNKKADELVRKKIKRLLDNIDNIVHAIRRIALELRPSFLDDLGLTTAIKWHLKEFGKNSGIETSFAEPEVEIDLPDTVKINLFRILQESLTNTARHSGADRVRVELLSGDDNVILIIHDNGCGFDDDNRGKKTLGILGMRERAAMVHGKFEIQNKQGKGTTITVTVPVKINLIES